MGSLLFSPLACYCEGPASASPLVVSPFLLLCFPLLLLTQTFVVFISEERFLMSGESSGGRSRPSLKAGGDIWDYWLGAEEVWSSGTYTLFILSGGPRRSRTDALRLASMRLRLIIQPCFISEFDIFALSLRPLLPCLPLLLLQSSSVSWGASVHPHILRLQQLTCRPEETSLFAGGELWGNTPLMLLR